MAPEPPGGMEKSDAPRTTAVRQPAPQSALAEQHRKQAEPGSGRQS